MVESSYLSSLFYMFTFIKKLFKITTTTNMIQHVTLKRLYLSTKLHGVKSTKEF
jgi:hypothetical protein